MNKWLTISLGAVIGITHIGMIGLLSNRESKLPSLDIPDAACHWYVANADNTFGEGFDWETAPWFDANGLNDVAPIQKQTVAQKLQDIG